MKLWNLDNGSIVIDHAQLMWNIGGGTPVRIPSYGVLIEHSDGLFLFDTGFDLEHTEKVLPFEFPEQTVDQTIPAQLGRCGFKPEDVGTLVNSHLHFDHVGGNKHLTSSRIVLHEKGMDFQIIDVDGRQCTDFQCFSARKLDKGIEVVNLSGRIRAVTHLDVDRAGVTRAAEVIAEIAAAL